MLDPIERVNTSQHPGYDTRRIVAGDNRKITLPKGFGSENMSAVRMFRPTASADEIEDFIAGVVIKAGSNSCPPVVVGVGLGGTLDSAAVEAKRALLRPLSGENPDRFYDEREKRIKETVNRSILHGTWRVTALAVHSAASDTHCRARASSIRAVMPTGMPRYIIRH